MALRLLLIILALALVAGGAHALTDDGAVRTEATGTSGCAFCV